MTFIDDKPLEPRPINDPVPDDEDYYNDEDAREAQEGQYTAWEIIDAQFKRS